jgi:hypothetical protein
MDANLTIRKLSYDYLNAQQMFSQLVVYIILSLPFRHASQSFSKKLIHHLDV